MDIGGKPMIQCVLEQCSKATSIDEVILCTDSKELKEIGEEGGQPRRAGHCSVMKVLVSPRRIMQRQRVDMQQSSSAAKFI